MYRLQYLPSGLNDAADVSASSSHIILRQMEEKQQRHLSLIAFLQLASNGACTLWKLVWQWLVDWMFICRGALVPSKIWSGLMR